MMNRNNTEKILRKNYRLFLKILQIFYVDLMSSSLMEGKKHNSFGLIMSKILTERLNRL